jgi:hypothetical protein
MFFMFVGIEVFKAVTMRNAGSSITDFSILKTEPMRSSETSVHTRSTRRYIPEDGILHFSVSQMLSAKVISVAPHVVVFRGQEI